MRIIPAGQLTELVTLQQLPTGQDAHGQENADWADVATVRAKAEPIRGRDFFAAAQTQAATVVRFVIRYRAGLPARLRVLWRGVPYDVQGAPIDVDARRVWLELMCEHGVRDGR